MTTSPLQPIDFSAFKNFEQANQGVLEYLKNKLGFGVWMTARTNLPHWIILGATNNNSYDIEPGTVFKWNDSFCAKMVAGKGPHVALDVTDYPEYLSAEIGKTVPIGAYIGVPMRADDGSLYGTLCAIDPNPQQLDIEKELPQIRLFAQLLSSILTSELHFAALERQLSQLSWDSHHDSLTSLLNHRGWEEAIQREQLHYNRYRGPITLFVMDLIGLKAINHEKGHSMGDELLKAAAHCLRFTVSASDLVARLGGDEFAIMAIDSTHDRSFSLFEKLQKVFKNANIKVSIGHAVHSPDHTLKETLQQAEQAMRHMKAEQKKPPPKLSA